MARSLKILLAAATLAYPVGVYLALGRVPPHWVALGLAVLTLLRAWSSRDVVWMFAGAGAAMLAVATYAGGSWLPLKLYPVMVSSLLLAVFAGSLWRPPTIVERIARLQDPRLTPEGVAYTRRVTQVWCAFFALNAAVALGTVVWGSDEAWLAYNGFISYLLVGLLFAAEWLVRQRVMRRAVPGGASRA